MWYVGLVIFFLNFFSAKKFGDLASWAPPPGVRKTTPSSDSVRTPGKGSQAHGYMGLIGHLLCH